MGWASGYVEPLKRCDNVRAGRFLIGNNRGFINGWIGAGAIYGRLLRVEP